METLNESISETLNQSTLFAEDIPVSPSALLESEKEQTTPDTYGLGSVTPLAYYDQSSRSWKMFGDISLWGELPSLENLPPSGMTRNGVLYQRPDWEPHIDANELLSWPTPLAGSWHSTGHRKILQRRVDDGTLTEQQAKDLSNGGKTNPAFHEWLMGFPIGWTDLKD